MASSFGIKIDNLRKRSRVLLTRLEENAKVVRKEVKKLRAKDSSSGSYFKKDLFIYGNNSDIWKTRNDSSGVGAALCPDYFRLSPKYESLSDPNMNANRRVLIKTDKKYLKPTPQRRGIKECYCYTSLPDTRKISQRSTRTKHKPTGPSPDDINVGNCGDGETVSVSELARIDSGEDSPRKRRENEELRYDYSPPLSAATLRRAQKIDYTPRSKFLRKVQSKVNSLRSSSESPVRPSQKSPSRKFVDTRIDTLGKNFDGTKNEGELFRKYDCKCVDNDDVNISRKIPKKTLLPKKTIVSKKVGNDQQKSTHCSRPVLRSPPPSKRLVGVIEKNDYTTGGKMWDKNLRHNSLPGYYGKSCPCSEGFYNRVEKLAGEFSEDEKFDLDINNVKKFREKNYFDTHASNPSLLGSRSSGSMQQFRLNERLFPELIGKIHRDDIIVSIPPCATRQKKTIHYFPRNIVKQEKNISHTNYPKKRRCPSCPLIGHAVDLGALKVSHPTNSLALRYQKGIP